MEGDADGAREVLMSGMRDDHAAAGAVHVTPRGFAGPNLLAMILFEKFGQHQPLNRSVRRLRVRLARSAAAASLRIAGAAQARQHRAQPVRLNSAACIASRGLRVGTNRDIERFFALRRSRS